MSIIHSVVSSCCQPPTLQPSRKLVTMTRLQRLGLDRVIQDLENIATGCWFIIHDGNWSERRPFIEFIESLTISSLPSHVSLWSWGTRFLRVEITFHCHVTGGYLTKSRGPMISPIQIGLHDSSSTWGLRMIFSVKTLSTVCPIVNIP